jgi:L-alanine-DL-glutamate epimerase-like enolase superfamily enzyme
MSPAEMLERLPGLGTALIGRDPHEVEAISLELTDGLDKPDEVSSCVDIAIWDLLGKFHNEPIYRLLGAARTRVRAYASTVMYETVQEWVDLALECRDQGFNAYKIHGRGVPDKDIEICRAVREAVGDTMDLMLDPVNAYDRRGAFKVGAVLEELGFFWFEAPVADTDLNGLADLTRSFRMEITAGEEIRKGLKSYPPYMTNHVVDSLRTIGDWVGGISAMRKVAALCEAFNLSFEPHSYGTTSIQAAHFHIMLSIRHCEFLELPVPLGIMDQGMADTLRPGPDGFVEAPTKPGLGYELDWDEIKRLTVKEVSTSS